MERSSQMRADDVGDQEVELRGHTVAVAVTIAGCTGGGGGVLQHQQHDKSPLHPIHDDFRCSRQSNPAAFDLSSSSSSSSSSSAAAAAAEEVPDISLFDIIRATSDSLSVFPYYSSHKGENNDSNNNEDNKGRSKANEFSGIHRFFIIMGVLPMDAFFLLLKPPISKNFLFKKEHGWVLLLYVYLFVTFVYYAGINTLGIDGWVSALSKITMLFQPIVVWVVLVLGWKVFRSKVTLPESEVLQALQYSVRAGWNIFYLLVAFDVTMSVYYAIDDAITGLGVNAVLETLFFNLFIYTPPMFFLSGTSALLIFQQRCSFQDMKNLESRIQEQMVCLADYVKTQSSIEKREKITPLNFFLVTAAINTLVSAILILAADEGNAAAMIDDILFSVGVIGRQVVVLLWILWECTCINEIPERIADEILLTEWREEVKYNRLSVHTALRFSAIGSEIFFYRPNKNEILLQIAGAAGSVVLSVGYKLLLSVQGAN